MNGILDPILPWIVSGIGGAIGAALLLPTKWGEALIQHRTNKLLEAYKSLHAKELELLKEQLSHLSDRGRRSNEMEFSAIETVWKSFVKAWLSTNSCVTSLIMLPDFGRMSDDNFEEFLSSSDLSDHERRSLRGAVNRQREYTSILCWRRVREARNDIYQARLTLREQRIFMPSSLTTEFNDVIERMSEAQIERELQLENPQIPRGEFGKSAYEWMKDSSAAFEGMAISANRRLFSDEEDHNSN